ncbi:MAG: hypothetical protein AAF685_16345 [Cyanobacteria bacterium P01_C01_bin.89]
MVPGLLNRATPWQYYVVFSGSVMFSGSILCATTHLSVAESSQQRKSK